MNSKMLLKMATGILCAGAVLFAQPKPKSQKEVDAIMAMFNATQPDARIAAANNLLSKFADTEFKGTALFMIASSYQQKNDMENMVAYAEKTLEADPKNFSAMLMISQALAQRTREFDLDKEEKLTRADKLAKQSQELIKVAPKPNPQLPDDQWEAAKKDYMAQSYEALGMIATARKKYPDAIANYKLSVESAVQQDPATAVRLAASYNSNGNFDQALPLLDKVLSDGAVNPAIKQFATTEKEKAMKGKAGAK
jgi:tetratricopeptide (TPR) repeat protein